MTKHKQIDEHLFWRLELNLDRHVRKLVNVGDLGEFIFDLRDIITVRQNDELELSLRSYFASPTETGGIL